MTRKDVHDGVYTVFAYNDESQDDIFIANLSVQYEALYDMYATDTRKAQVISMTDVDSALLQTGYPVNMTAEGSDSLLLTMYGRDSLDVNNKFMQDCD